MSPRVVGVDPGIAERFWSKVQKSAPDECWLWTAYIGTHGYGRLRIGGRSGGMVGAHVVSHLLNVGPIPDGFDVHHVCRNRACVNPAHLAAVTHAENCSPANSVAAAVNAARQRAVTTCPSGHQYADHGSTRPNGRSRRCRECDRVRATDQHDAIRAARERLGLTHREYVARFGSSRATALALAEGRAA